MHDAVVRHEEASGIHVLTLDDGANALSLELLETLGERLAQLRKDSAPPVVLASSHPTLFCPGWDLKQLAGADRGEVSGVLAAFDRLILELFSYPAPTAAAMAGHAVAGGCLMALACDLRVMASGSARLGLAELNLGVPVPAPSLRMLRSRLDHGVVEELVLRGVGCSAERARDLGLVQMVAQVSEVVAVAQRELGRLMSKPAHAYAASKRFLYGGAWREMAELSTGEMATFLECWFHEATQARIVEVARSLS
jgi:enoyl-CoA hydratase